MATQWGARPIGGGKWRFGLWAPDAEEARVEIAGIALPALAAGDGWWMFETEAQAGDAYRWLLEGTPYPDPAARAQVGDVHGPSMLVDPGAYAWQNDWQGRPWHEAVIYELHMGTFTEEGTFAAAIDRLPEIATLGATMVEIMPVAQFEGARGWGYDGVLPYAPHPAYGSPDDLRALVDAAHGLGLGVMMDVVYNHFGPSGNYLGAWCPSFFHPERASPWGEGIAFETAAVREYFIGNALHWLDEYRLDGLRFDAVHTIEDHSETHFLDELGQRIRASDRGRPIHLVTEDERNLARYFTPDAPFDATWNDDWHHAAHCLLTGEDESYYAPFAIDPVADLATALADGYVEQGQPRVNGDEEPRGEPSAALPRTCFINFLGNHDQVGNRAKGERLHHLAPDHHAYRVLTAMTLLAPFTPMIFMGDEFLTDAPFQFFVDFNGDLAEAVRQGRAREFARFSSFGGTVPDPVAQETFDASKIGQAIRSDQREHEAFVRELLAVRRNHIWPLLADRTLPESNVMRDGNYITARWRFPAATVEMQARLGSSIDPFRPHADPIFQVTNGQSPYALSMAIIQE